MPSSAKSRHINILARAVWERDGESGPIPKFGKRTSWTNWAQRGWGSTLIRPSHRGTFSKAASTEPPKRSRRSRDFPAGKERWRPVVQWMGRDRHRISAWAIPRVPIHPSLHLILWLDLLAGYLHYLSVAHMLRYRNARRLGNFWGL